MTKAAPSRGRFFVTPSGVIYAILLLETLRRLDQAETHLVMLATARMNIALETDWKAANVEGLAQCFKGETRRR